MAGTDRPLPRLEAKPSPFPSIGRIVHYRSRGSADGRFPAVCRAAVVTDIAIPPMLGISICVLNPTGIFFDSGVEEDDGDSRPGTWHWPEKFD